MMSSKRTLTVFVVVSASLLAIATLTLRTRADDEKRAERLEKRIEQLTELVESTPRVEERRTIVETRVPGDVPLVPTPAAEAEPAVAEEARAVDGEELEPPSTEDKAAYAQSVFETEPLDAGWATHTKNDLNTALGQHLGTSTLAALECRSALCRAEVEHASKDELQKFLDGVLLHSHDVWQGAMAIYQVETADDGRVVQNLYFAREGTKIPRL